MPERNIVFFFQSMVEVYSAMCTPVCKKHSISQTEFDILMFLANNPVYQTAKDITKWRGIKRNLVSFYVEQLVQSGYLTREPMPGDRRQIKLLCTDQVQPIVKDGRQMQQDFFALLTQGLSAEALEYYHQIQRTMLENITAYKEVKRR